MFGKENPFYPVLCLLLLSALSCWGQNNTIILGGKTGWPAFSQSKGIAFTEGRFGHDAVTLNTDSAQLTQDSDLLLSFEGTELSDNAALLDNASNYTVVSSALLTSGKAAMGKQAGLSTGLREGLRLSGKPGSIFGTEGNPGSFTIEFWLCPSIAENGEQLFSWRSSRNRDNYPIYQTITASILNNRTEWNFTNLFTRRDGAPVDISLSSYSTVIPGQWTHHQLSFEEESGLLEYKINGKTEAVKYATSTGREYGDVFTPILGVPADIELCPHFTGLIDDVRIRRSYQAEQKRPDTYSLSAGRFETQPIPAKTSQASLVSLDAEMTLPQETATVFYARAGDNFYLWNETTPPWIQITPGTTVSGVTGKYFQIAAELYPDGRGSKTPTLHSVSLSVTESTPPWPPAHVFAKAGNGYADISWIPSVNYDTTGYLVYYGERPGEYLGAGAVQGDSPLSAGNKLSLRIEGLTNGKIYYFAVAAYTASQAMLSPTITPGELSKEVFARPDRNSSSKEETP
ncbi:MAG: hypothetical protein LBU99_01250 [Spirochaetaceae bacterium]|jgi:hypothetical protein|nr:hypothetical protein [Spirochaetaceae bacterium]